MIVFMVIGNVEFQLEIRMGIRVKWEKLQGGRKLQLIEVEAHWANHSIALEGSISRDYYTYTYEHWEVFSIHSIIIIITNNSPF